VLLVCASKQAVEIVIQIALALAHGRRVAKQHQQAVLQRQVAAGDIGQHGVHHLDGCCLVTVYAAGQQDVAAIRMGWAGSSSTALSACQRARTPAGQVPVLHGEGRGLQYLLQKAGGWSGHRQSMRNVNG
jgi:hypothetical protein